MVVMPTGRMRAVGMSERIPRACRRLDDLKAYVRTSIGACAGSRRVMRHRLELRRKTAEAVCDASEPGGPPWQGLVVVVRAGAIPFRQVAAIVC